MDVAESVLIDVPLTRAWPLLSDVAVVVACLPGARLDGVTESDGEYAGALDVRMGPTRASFAGKVRFEVDDQAHRIDIEGRGQDSKGRTRAAVRLAVVAEERSQAQTTLTVDGKIDVVGALERFAATGGAHLARELMSAFASNLADHVERSDAVATHLGDGSHAASPGAEQRCQIDLPNHQALSLVSLIRRFLRRVLGRHR